MNEAIALWLKAEFPDLEIDSTIYKTAYTSKGRYFDILCSGGIKQEGQPAPVLCLTPELAEILYRRALKHYIKLGMPGGKLLWRQPPEMETVTFAGHTRYFVYSRLCIEKEFSDED